MRIYIVEDNLLPAHYRQSLASSSSSSSSRSSLKDPNFKDTRRWHHMDAKTQIQIEVCSNSAGINIFLVLLIRSVGDQGALSNQSRESTTSPFPAAQNTKLSGGWYYSPPLPTILLRKPYSPTLHFYILLLGTPNSPPLLWLWTFKQASTHSELKNLIRIENTPQ